MDKEDIIAILKASGPEDIRAHKRGYTGAAATSYDQGMHDQWLITVLHFAKQYNEDYIDFVIDCGVAQ